MEIINKYGIELRMRKSVNPGRAQHSVEKTHPNVTVHDQTDTEKPIKHRIVTSACDESRGG